MCFLHFIQHIGSIKKRRIKNRENNKFQGETKARCKVRNETKFLLGGNSVFLFISVWTFCKSCQMSIRWKETEGLEMPDKRDFWLISIFCKSFCRSYLIYFPFGIFVQMNKLLKKCIYTQHFHFQSDLQRTEWWVMALRCAVGSESHDWLWRKAERGEREKKRRERRIHFK